MCTSLIKAELKGFSLDNFDRLSEMKDRSESLRSAREEERKNIAEEKLYEHFRQNCPDLRKVSTLIVCSILAIIMGNCGK